MLSPSLRSLRSTVCRVQGRRFASHETPQYNEPSGYLFGEKVLVLVRLSVLTTVPNPEVLILSPLHLAKRE